MCGRPVHTEVYKSNSFIGQAAEISVAEGSLLVLYNRQNGLPHREGHQ